MFHGTVLTLALVLGFSSIASAQQVVPVGKGSYAGSVPPGSGDGLGKIESEKRYLVKEDERPLPSNKWWTQLIVSQYARSLWVYPFKVDTHQNGLDIFFPTRWAAPGNDPESEFPLTVGGKDFHPADARAKDWSDWLVSFRMAENAEHYMDVTLGEGMPYVWIEYHGVQPLISLPNNAKAKFFDVTGKDTSLADAKDAVGVEYEKRRYGLFAPDGTRFLEQGGKLSVAFAGSAKSHYLVVCALPDAKSISVFHKYAYAIPRDTQLSWTYDAQKGSVTTTWKITTEPLKGSEKKIIQGWIPHHYRDNVNDLAFNGLEYLSPRGKLKCATGNEFKITYSFNGIVPNLPAPKSAGGPHDYDPARMHTYLAELAAKPQTGADTYWGGKDILRLGQCALMAQQTHDATYPTFVKSLKTAMEDWFTYRPGEKDHFFAYYPKWKALVGVKSSYGSEGFNDHHFHYGYFTFASALLAMHDPAFAKDYGDMATLVAKEYANWNREDKRLPFLRTFDAWAGHSWAGGTSSPGGNNQESSSEAVQSWAGLIYLGQALGNKDMLAASVMGYAMESRATMEYWFNVGGDVFPPEWKHPVTGMIWGGGKAFGTYFTGDPAWIYGIQWLPASPMLSYLVRDPAFARKSYENMLKDFDTHEHEEAAKSHQPAKPGTIKSFGPALGSVMLGYVLMYDPDWTAEQLDTLWSEPGDKIAHDASEMAVIYYQTHAMRNLGLVDWSVRGDSPTSMAFTNAKTKAMTYVTWNPTSAAQSVEYFRKEKNAGFVHAAAQSLAADNKLTTK